MDHVIVALVAMLAAAAAALAGEAAQLFPGYGLINAPPAPRAAIVLIPGGNGWLGIRADGSFSALRGSQPVRTRQAYAAAGVASLLVDGGVSAVSAAAYPRQRFNRPVTVAGTSRGSLRIAQALGARWHRHHRRLPRPGARSDRLAGRPASDAVRASAPRRLPNDALRRQAVQGLRAERGRGSSGSTADRIAAIPARPADITASRGTTAGWWG